MVSLIPPIPTPSLLERKLVRRPDVHSEGLMLCFLDSRPCRAEARVIDSQVNSPCNSALRVSEACYLEREKPEVVYSNDYNKTALT